MSIPLPVVACHLTAINPEQRPGHEQNIRQLFSLVTQTQELTAGWAFYWPNQGDIFLHLAQFIALEQKCCPFFTFTLVIEPQQQGLWLQLTGSAEIKQFIQTEFGQLLKES